MPRLALIVLVAGLAPACAARMAPGPPAAANGGVRFVFERPAAQTVAVAGTFNEWAVASHPLVRDRKSGLWTAVIAVPPGDHLFMYVVDGSQWVSPPHAADYADDGFGSRNGVLSVRPVER